MSQICYTTRVCLQLLVTESSISIFRNYSMYVTLDQSVRGSNGIAGRSIPLVYIDVYLTFDSEFVFV